MPTQDALSNTVSAVKSARAAQRFSMGEFATELGVTRQAVSEWENGLSAPSLDRIEAWLADKRPWVYQMAFNILVARFGRALLAAAALPTEAA